MEAQLVSLGFACISIGLNGFHAIPIGFIWFRSISSDLTWSHVVQLISYDVMWFHDWMLAAVTGPARPKQFRAERTMGLLSPHICINLSPSIQTLTYKHL